MYLKSLLISGLLLSSSFGDNSSGGKFIVVDNTTFEKVKTLNMLEGGIKQQFVLSSTKIDSSDLNKYYPEHLLYDGEKCTVVNDVIDVDTNAQVVASVIKLKTPSKIDDEVKKIKLLQILVNSSNKSEIQKNTIENTTPKTIKAIGIICDNELVLRGKRYEQDDLVGNIRINSISKTNSTVYVRVR